MRESCGVDWRATPDQAAGVGREATSHSSVAHRRPSSIAFISTVLMPLILLISTTHVNIKIIAHETYRTYHRCGRVFEGRIHSNGLDGFHESVARRPFEGCRAMHFRSARRSHSLLHASTMFRFHQIAGCKLYCSPDSSWGACSI